MEYKKLVDLYDKLENTTKRLEKTYHISEFLKSIKEYKVDLNKCILLIKGNIYPAWDETKIGVATKLVMKAINVTSGISVKEIEKEWKKIGDLGEVAKKLVSNKKQATLFSKSLSTDKVFSNLRKISESEGEGSVDRKVKLISELLSGASPDEAKYIVRTVLEDLRIGVGDGSIRDALVWAYDGWGKYYDIENKEFNIDSEREKYNKVVETVQKAVDITNDFGIIGELLKEEGLKGLDKVKFALGKPLKVMLYPKAKDIEDAFKTVGKPAAFEYKYDGFRIQVHKANGKVTLFTRRLENVTKQFPEIIKLVQKNITGDNFVLDSEAVGYDYKSGKYLPFQNISQRIRRKYDIESMAKKYPVELVIFDILSYEGKSKLNDHFLERRKLLDTIVKEEKKKIVLAQQIITEDKEKAEKFYQESLKSGNEGVMVKNLEGIYKPGSRVGYGVKVKPVMESLDLAIVKAEWGTGKRAGWLTSFTLACVDDEKYLEIGKVGTGFKEKEEGVKFAEMTKILKKLIINEKGKEVELKPEIIIEINYEEIQKSQTYSSGFALRFPRIIRIRDDRKDPDTLERVEDLYYNQRSR